MQLINELSIPECPIKISKEPDVIKVEGCENVLQFSRPPYYIKLDLN